MSTLTETRVADRTAAAVEMTYRDAINLALKDEMTADPSVVLMGEDGHFHPEWTYGRDPYPSRPATGSPG